MPRRIYKPKEIIAKLRQVEILTSHGKSAVDAIRSIGVTDATYYRWRQEYGGLRVDQVKRMKELEADMVATQERLKYGRASGIEFGPIDDIKYAEAFGATGLMIDTPDHVAPVMEKAFDTPGPVIVGVHVDYRDNHKSFVMIKGDNFH
jgi:hypothetical protein